MATIPLHIDDSDLKKIDYLIKIGRYKNRIQAVKSIFQSKLGQESIPIEWESADDEVEIQTVVDEISSPPQLKITWLTTKSAVNLVREMRD
jgi:Arc/MetJ-type ribon-helix-helix transcriptional regulator